MIYKITDWIVSIIAVITGVFLLPNVGQFLLLVLIGSAINPKVREYVDKL